jgi:hypothetical protein
MHHNLGNMLLSSHCIYLSDVRPSAQRQLHKKEANNSEEASLSSIMVSNFSYYFLPRMYSTCNCNSQRGLQTEI